MAPTENRSSNVDWFPALPQYDYLTLEFIRRAQGIFDEAESAVAGDAATSPRARKAIPVRATVNLARILISPHETISFDSQTYDCRSF